MPTRQSKSTIARVIDDDGQVRDDASPALRKIRRELKGSQGELIKLLERAMAKLESAPARRRHVGDRPQWPLRDSGSSRSARGRRRHRPRRVAAREERFSSSRLQRSKRAIESASSQSEEDRRGRAHSCRADRTDSSASGRAAAQPRSARSYSTHWWRARRYAIEFRCAPADLTDPTEGFSVVQGRHPLLIAQGIDVVPFDLEMCPNERTLLISGPNTGGKTVLLKALGLFSALVQSGIPAPVAAGSRIAIFDDIYADVGDEQSILASLSTFSAHLKNLVEVLSSATAHSLVLIDELGSGTDPDRRRRAGRSDSRGAHGARDAIGGDHAPRRAEGARDGSRRRRERVAAIRSRRARADISTHQGNSGSLLWHQHRAAFEFARRCSRAS